MNTFTTKAEAINFLVSQGVKQNLATAAINEQYCGHEYLLYDAGDEVEVTATPNDINQVWLTYENQLLVTHNGIMFNGDLVYDLNGNYL